MEHGPSAYAPRVQRAHLVELEDLPWVPAAVRDGGTDLLDAFFGRIGFYRGAVDVLERALEASGSPDVVDLCSGGGGGALHLREALLARGRAVRLVLTDRHPNAAAQARVQGLDGVTYHPDPVDAAAVPAALSGLRTMFGALHHFRPAEVQALLGGAVAARARLAFFDVAASPLVRRTPAPLFPLAALPNALVLLLLPLLLTPLVRPLRLSRLALTYLVPAIPLLFAWDGTVSAIRAYAPEELLALARAVPGADGYAWDAGRAGQALWLTGAPR